MAIQTGILFCEGLFHSHQVSQSLKFKTFYFNLRYRGGAQPTAAALTLNGATPNDM